MKNIIEKAYQVFQGNRLTNQLDACTRCCMTASEVQVFKATPLRLLSANLLSIYQDAAKPDKLDKSELKYLVPRYLDLVAQYQYPAFDPLLSFDTFSRLAETDWTKEEKELLNEFALRFIQIYLHRPFDELTILMVDILLMFHRGGFDLDILLDQWTEATSKESVILFAQFLDDIQHDKGTNIRVYHPSSDPDFDRCIAQWIGQKTLREYFKNKIEQFIIESKEELSEDEISQLSWRYDMIW